MQEQIQDRRRVSTPDTLFLDSAEHHRIRSFRHRGLEKFFHIGSRAGIQPAHAKPLALQLGALELSRRVEQMNVPGWDLHSLKGELADHWSVKVNGNWLLTFRFHDGDAYIVDYQDYH